MKTAAAMLTLTLTACSSTSSPPATTTAPLTTVVTVAATDPYEVYLTLPGADPGLSRDDAQLRALLGCGKPFAPGTTDAALAEAYGPLVEEWKAQGMCPATSSWCRTPLFPSTQAEVGVVRNACGDPMWVQVCCAYCWLDDAEAEDVEVYS